MSSPPPRSDPATFDHSPYDESLEPSDKSPVPGKSAADYLSELSGLFSGGSQADTDELTNESKEKSSVLPKSGVFSRASDSTAEISSNEPSGVFGNSFSAGLGGQREFPQGNSVIKSNKLPDGHSLSVDKSDATSQSGDKVGVSNEGHHVDDSTGAGFLKSDSGNVSSKVTSKEGQGAEIGAESDKDVVTRDESI